MRKTTPEELSATRDDFEELSAAVARLRGTAEVSRFLEELFTPSECIEFSKRWALMRELLAGKSQRTIARELGLSLCKITRGAKYAHDPDSLLRRCALAARPGIGPAGQETPSPREKPRR